ncbi:a67dc8cd-ee5a-424d-bfc7-99871d0ac642 [Sclerotinia trifoliorum]|uniref:A67dc8cd-ee5a-424d-bfc7-99871d0ac642 n=1 Tax=Sclerotinia trifoliorum TaxID=28548 RepID=A0A8H2VNW5_9HELO|nr:a67dc8cd-ee5a-424d-bfc7-99871d0ac642 [Sclerotinia trifoliorum]
MRCPICHHENMTGVQKCEQCTALLPGKHLSMQAFTINYGNKTGKTSATAKVEKRIEFSTRYNDAVGKECTLVSMNINGTQIAVTVSDNHVEPVLVSVARPNENVQSAKCESVFRV